jgi:translation elongation factor EF-Tu-like GTPase
MQLLSTVEDSFQIDGRGCIVTLTLPEDVCRNIVRKEKIRLIAPSGSTFDTEIEELEVMKKGLLDRTAIGKHLAFTLPQSLTRTDVPRGTEIWLFNE